MTEFPKDVDYSGPDVNTDDDILTDGSGGIQLVFSDDDNEVGGVGEEGQLENQTT